MNKQQRQHDEARRGALRCFVLTAIVVCALVRLIWSQSSHSTQTSKGSTSWNPALAVGGFDLIYDESLMAATAAGDDAGGAAAAAAGGRMGGRGGAGPTGGSSSGSSSGATGAAARGGGFGPATPAPAAGMAGGAASAPYSYGAPASQSGEPRPATGKWR